MGAYSKNWTLAESIQINTKIQGQASSKCGGGGFGGWVVTSISYSYYVLMEYIYPYDVL